MTRAADERIDDILTAIERCVSYREFLKSADHSAMAYDAVLRNLAVIGEAVRALPTEFKAERASVEDGARHLSGEGHAPPVEVKVPTFAVALVDPDDIDI